MPPTARPRRSVARFPAPSRKSTLAPAPGETGRTAPPRRDRTGRMIRSALPAGRIAEQIAGVEEVPPWRDRAGSSASHAANLEQMTSGHACSRSGCGVRVRASPGRGRPGRRRDGPVAGEPAPANRTYAPQPSEDDALGMRRVALDGRLAEIDHRTPCVVATAIATELGRSGGASARPPRRAARDRERPAGHRPVGARAQLSAPARPRPRTAAPRRAGCPATAGGRTPSAASCR